MSLITVDLLRSLINEYCGECDFDQSNNFIQRSNVVSRLYNLPQDDDTKKINIVLEMINLKLYGLGSIRFAPDELEETFTMSRYAQPGQGPNIISIKGFIYLDGDYNNERVPLMEFCDKYLSSRNPDNECLVNRIFEAIVKLARSGIYIYLLLLL